jgi:protein-L-isoaspartate(D-aspartate) O-methyltransferase
MNNLSILISQLEKKNILKSASIKDALLKVDRANFVLSDYTDNAYEDRPLPIGEGQTISQPSTVVFMLELLEVTSGQKVLDIGAGSGWTSGLLAELVGKEGKVFAIERIGTLKSFGEQNIKKLNYQNVQFIEGNGAKGLPHEAPFDRILVNAGAKMIPPALKEQLKVNGKLVIPLSDTYGNLVLVDKIEEDKYKKTCFPGFAFVPFVD